MQLSEGRYSLAAVESDAEEGALAQQAWENVGSVMLNLYISSSANNHITEETGA